MKRLELDFAARRAASPWVGRVLLAAAIAFAVDVGLAYRGARDALAASKATLAKAQPRAASRKVSAEEIALARDTVARLSTPWERLFGALESAAGEQVALLAIEPDPQAGTVTILGDSKDYLAALTYVLNLSRAESLSRVQLLRHERKANAVAFAVSASWSEARR